MHVHLMEAEKCNFPHDAHFRMRRTSSACGRTFSACGDEPPHAEVPSRRAETLLRMRNCLLSVRRPYSACGIAFSECGDVPPHAEMHFSACGDYPRMRRCTSRRAETIPPHAEMHFSACGDYPRMRRCTSRRAETTSACGDALLGVRRPCSACGGSVFTCGDPFSKLSQPSRFNTPLVLIVASILAWLTS